ncbi:phage tail protein, partial [Providencia rettgeri]
MKYFALLTKLGENLLAQATALGTKLELTHMAVGDGGGSLPTPDTNQTKLIAEKRRAAINTLFIDDKNKNQIIAEQIIPEQDGGWWIREIGLFDKAGNLIAVANCPETYKPQLAEGSGRTQSIRMVLIVSHTESVTLKIDPSVVLATREYVNTEITVLDKKIDVLSAQTKLDLNKKIDKANISGVKGNDNDKVPSLNLFTTETGKLATKAELTSGLAGKQPAGEYVTTENLNNELTKKRDVNDLSFKGTVNLLNPSKDDFLNFGSDGAGYALQVSIANNNTNGRFYFHDRAGKKTIYLPIHEKSGTIALTADIPNVVNATGSSATDIMSQNSVTNELNKKFDKTGGVITTTSKAIDIATRASSAGYIQISDENAKAIHQIGKLGADSSLSIKNASENVSVTIKGDGVRFNGSQLALKSEIPSFVTKFQ